MYKVCFDQEKYTKLQSERIIPAGNHRDMPQTTGTNAGIDQTGIHSS